MKSKEIRHKELTDRVKWCEGLLNEVAPNRKRIGIEVGLWKADFAKLMLMEDPLLYWIGVDPYIMYGKRARGQNDWNEIHQKVLNKMTEFDNRFTLVRRTSEEGASHIRDQFADFVFIDGNHDYEFVKKDLLLYEAKVKPGGIMSGHDYHTPKEGVRRAVNEYVKEHNRDIQTDDSWDPCGVFWWRVPK